MKYLSLLLLTFFALSFVNAQPCLPEGITFSTQEQIDNFQLNYPGCTEIEGDVLIHDGIHDFITNLSGLNVIISIAGDLKIYGNDLLENTAGLESLISIGDDLYINDNIYLTSLSGLDNLTTVGDDIIIDFNNSLVSFDGLENLTSVGGYLRITRNDALNSLAALGNLSFIGGHLIIGDVHYGGNDDLITLAGLENLNSIGGDLLINGNQFLNNLTALENLSSIRGDLIISGNQFLSSLSGLENIEAGSVSDLLIFDNWSLSVCSAENFCDYLVRPNGIVEIHDNATGCNSPIELATGCGINLPCLPYGNYYFLNQSDIDDFSQNFPGCTDLAGNVSISSLDITNLEGLSSITSIGGDLSIINTEALTNLSGLDSLSSVGRYLCIYENLSLENFSGLENLVSIGGGLVVGEFRLSAGNDALTSISGLEHLSSIGGWVEFYGNNSLTNLSGLSGLTSVAGYILILNNNGLSSLSGLDNIDAGLISEILVYGNISLSFCEIQSICEYLISPYGSVSIHDNAPGCNSPEEVETACETLSLEENSINQDFSISPNPSSGRLTINFNLDALSPVNVVVHNSLGQVVEILLDETLTPGFHQVNWNAGNLPEGIYFYQMQAGNLSKTGKMILMK
jgi:hypothetical protein